MVVLVLIGGAERVAWAVPAPAATRAMLRENIERPLRYAPDGHDFVIRNGEEFFIRPLYGSNAAFRADAGDRPEVSLYLPGHGGNLRFGVISKGGAKWLHAASDIEARYQPGSMVYAIRDEALGGELRLAVQGMRQAEGVIARIELAEPSGPVELLIAYGGAGGRRGRRNGDIGTESVPMSQFFQLRPEYCRGNEYEIDGNGFLMTAKLATIAGASSAAMTFDIADAHGWNDLPRLLEFAGRESPEPVIIGRAIIQPGAPAFVALQRVQARGTTRPSPDLPDRGYAPDELSRVYEETEAARRAVATWIEVDTPDPFINAAAAALCIAADGTWDDRQSAVMHGAVAWRNRLLGWRGIYWCDALGQHALTRRHLGNWFPRQNSDPVPDPFPPPVEASANLSRNETALHSNGDLTRSHYDMNMVAIDALLRHLRWTGDLEYARQVWPVIERHLAWERRLFRRTFGEGEAALPLYEAYANIWASDSVFYNGGGVTQASAQNLYHHRQAARVGRMIGKDSLAAEYDREADLIARGMKQYLWLGEQGIFAEWKDRLGLQRLHENPALWTFYHTIDSHAATPLEAWQMARFVETGLAHIPVRGDGVDADEGLYVLPTTNWMPYIYSTNNVVLAENAHGALGLWQAGRGDEAFKVFKGTLLTGMFAGLCPGNAGMAQHFDAYRGESQRDFADGVGATARALVEGLFGVRPDALAGELLLRPGFPAAWKRASLKHPSLDVAFERKGSTDTYRVRFKQRPLKLRLHASAPRDGIAAVRVNGEPAKWTSRDDEVSFPRIEIVADAAETHQIEIDWHGEQPAAAPKETVAVQGAKHQFDTSPATVIELSDPQQAAADAEIDGGRVRAVASGALGHRTLFARVRQGDLTWWMPLPVEIRSTTEQRPQEWPTDPPRGPLESIDLRDHFNDRVTQIFRNEYLSPRSPYVSLAVPKHGYSNWCRPTETFEVDDSGLRRAADEGGGKILIPPGIPLATPGTDGGANVLFTSRWDNYPAEASVPLDGRASHAYLLMAGSTHSMASRFDNGEVIVTYGDGTQARLALHNPTTWWPIDQDYLIDDFAFRRPEPIPPRVDLKTGKVRIEKLPDFKGRGRTVEGGAATVLDLPLDPSKELKSLTVRALANEVVIGLMSITLVRP